MAENKSNININNHSAEVGLNTDSVLSKIGPGSLTDAWDANLSSYDGQAVEYSNDQGNVLCFTEPDGYKIIGRKNITELNQVIYYLTNPSTGNSLISYVLNNNCTLINLLDDTISGSDLLEFNISNPILKTEIKTTNCATQFYFTDALNNRRYIDLNNLPWKDTLIGGIITPLVGQIDTNKMLVQPVFTIPQLKASSIEIGGNITEGTYQFTVQYANVNSEGLTGFYSVTNPVSIFLDHNISPNFNRITNKAITVNISNLDTTGLYTYFNLAVVKTINGALAGVDLVGTFQIQASNYNHTYTGLEQSNANIKLDITQILEKYNYYDIAGDLTQVDNSLVWTDLTKEEDNSYQKIWNDVKVNWATSQMPTGQNLGYHDGSISANYKGYHRDEVYALEGCLVLSNGRELARGHIPGRIANAFDLSPVPYNNDVNAIIEGTCPTPLLPMWKVYNTGNVIGLLPGAVDPCNGIKPWEYGEMSYWESTELYPNKPEQWGILANTPIRHHKFPDNLITHIHDQNPFLIGSDQYNNFNPNIYPIGFKVDIQSLYHAIQISTDLTPAEKRQIVGFKIMRSDRGANRTIIAKGIISNCGEYTKDTQTYFYANYPFNDVRPDPFISNLPVQNKSGDNKTNLLSTFHQDRYTFHSPDTHFYQPSGIQNSFLKLETAEYGQCKSHFVQVQDNAKEKLKTQKDLDIALAAGIVAVFGINVSITNTATASIPPSTATSVDIAPVVHPQDFFPAFNNMLELLDKLIPYYNYGWQYNGVGYYCNYQPIANSGDKIRLINFGGYITPGLNNSLGDINQINNTFRESSVYLSLNDSLPYTHQIGVPQDTSRQTASQAGVCGTSTPFYESISSYYASIKRNLPDQYGQIFSYVPVDTGTYSTFFDTNLNQITDLPIVYGGDIFIHEFDLKVKHSFFLKQTVNLPDGSDIDYNQDSLPSAPTSSYTNTGNIGYPIWYYSTDNELVNINNGNISGQITNFVNTFSTFPGLLLSLLTGGLLPLAQSWLLLIELFSQIFVTLGLKITNLDCANYDDLYEKGEAYQYAYGVLRFFVESEVNVDMRQAYNNKEGDFYPNVASGIPDQWLQETNVPIAFDNTYTYNKTFSKQNKETFFQTLRADWEPNQTCYTNFNNRAIWSDKSDLEETKNNWLVYRPSNLFEFPKGYGKLISIDYLENREVLVRFENRSQIYNAMATIGTTALTASLGTGALFSGSLPLDLSNTDAGSHGTQNKFISHNENGHIFIDAKRGEVCLLRGHSIEDLASPKYLNSKWFKQNLPFNILDSFPNIDIDNNYNGIGIHGVYDGFYHRFILTKVDYQPIVEGIQYDGTNFYINQTEEVASYITIPGVIACCPIGYTQRDHTPPCQSNENEDIFVPFIECPSTVEEVTIQGQGKIIVNLNNPLYFCNKSWTISFSFLTNSWVSKHHFIPNFYVEYEDYFQAGLNTDPNSNNDCTIWNHNTTFDLFNNYFGVSCPYILEYPFSYKLLNEKLQSITDYCTVLKPIGFQEYTELDDNSYFDSVICYNNQQNSGLRVFVPKDNTNLFQNRKYPIYNTNSISILVEKTNNLFHYNMLWDITNDSTKTTWLANCQTSIGDKQLDNSNLIYINRSFKKYLLQAKECKIRLNLSSRNDIKIISRFILIETQNDYK